MTNDRIYNFSAGPSILPETVLCKAQEELLNYQGSGMSVMEMSHRSKVYDTIISETMASLRELMSIPDDYHVLFLHGGATGMFAALAMNLGNRNGIADYVLSGNFSKNAYKEGKKYLKDCRVAGTTEEENFSRIPKGKELAFSKDADYAHICWNNTIFGTCYHEVPDTGEVPLVADMSSSILSEPVDVSRFGMIYAGAQKNMGPAGLAVVIVRKDLCGHAMDITPSMWDFALEADKGSMLNTPATYPIYVMGLVLSYLKHTIGGLDNMQSINRKKASILYDYLDGQSFYKATAAKEDRSMMNVTFRTGSEELDKAFVAASAKNGFSNLKGHRLVGGMRASIYNAMPEEGIVALVDFMDRFAKENA